MNPFSNSGLTDRRLAACRRLAKALTDQAEEERRSHQSMTKITLGEDLAANFDDLDAMLTAGHEIPRDWRTE